MKWLIIERRDTWACYFLCIPHILIVHWHVGHHDGSRPGDPRVRLRAVFLFDRRVRWFQRWEAID